MILYTHPPSPHAGRGHGVSRSGRSGRSGHTDIQSLHPHQGAMIRDILQRKLRAPVQQLNMGGEYSLMYMVRRPGMQPRLIKVTTSADGEREAEILRHIMHAPQIRSMCGVLDAKRYVPKLYSAGAIGKNIYFQVMEYIQGGETLTNLLQRAAAGRVPIQILRRVHDHLHRAQQALYGLGVFHGDLHSSNVMIKNGDVYILDYGFATFVPELSKYACHPENVPESVVYAMRRRHHQYGRQMMYDNRAMYAKHIGMLEAAIRRMDRPPGPRSSPVLKSVRRDIRVRPSPFG